jgi:hypothetical protein
VASSLNYSSRLHRARQAWAGGERVARVSPVGGTRPETECRGGNAWGGWRSQQLVPALFGEARGLIRPWPTPLALLVALRFLFLTAHTWSNFSFFCLCLCSCSCARLAVLWPLLGVLLRRQFA